MMAEIWTGGQACGPDLARCGQKAKQVKDKMNKPKRPCGASSSRDGLGLMMAVTVFFWRTHMNAKTFAVDAAVFADIHSTEVFGKGVREENKERTAALNERKIAAYAGLIASINGVKLVKGNLPKYARDKVWEGLTVDAGCSKAVAKKYLENSVGAVREFDFPSQATGAYVEARLIEEGIDSEAKLAKVVKGEGDVSPEKAVAEKIIGKFTTKKDDDGNRAPGVFKPSKEVENESPRDVAERYVAAIMEQVRIAEAAAAAASEADAERATYEQVMAALDD